MNKVQSDSNQVALMGYVGIDKEAGLKDIMFKVIDAMRNGKLKGIPMEALTAGGGSLFGSIIGALMSPNNRLLGGLGGLLLGSGLGYFGGRYGVPAIGRFLHNRTLPTRTDHLRGQGQRIAPQSPNQIDFAPVDDGKIYSDPDDVRTRWAQSTRWRAPRGNEVGISPAIPGFTDLPQMVPDTDVPKAYPAGYPTYATPANTVVTPDGDGDKGGVKPTGGGVGFGTGKLEVPGGVFHMIRNGVLDRVKN